MGMQARGQPRIRPAGIALLAAIALGTTELYAESPPKDPAAVLELGGAAAWGVPAGGFSGGPTVAAEVTPIEDWLELEGGLTGLFAKGSTEWDTDLVFKKPWTLSRRAEFMAGIGPEWVPTRQGGVTSNAIAGEGVLDFMFWPAKRHKFGWYFEPSYDYSFGQGHEQSAGVTGGLLIAIP